MLVVGLCGSELGFPDCEFVRGLARADLCDDLGDLGLEQLDVGLGLLALRSELQELLLHPLLELSSFTLGLDVFQGDFEVLRRRDFFRPGVEGVDVFNLVRHQEAPLGEFLVVARDGISALDDHRRLLHLHRRGSQVRVRRGPDVVRGGSEVVRANSLTFFAELDTLQGDEGLIQVVEFLELLLHPAPDALEDRRVDLRTLFSHQL